MRKAGALCCGRPQTGSAVGAPSLAGGGVFESMGGKQVSSISITFLLERGVSCRTASRGLHCSNSVLCDSPHVAELAPGFSFRGLPSRPLFLHVRLGDVPAEAMIWVRKCGLTVWARAYCRVGRSCLEVHE